MLDLIAALTLVFAAIGLLALILLALERKPTKARGRKAGKLDCWL